MTVEINRIDSGAFICLKNDGTIYYDV